MGFLDADLTNRFLDSFRASGGRFVGGVETAEVVFDGVNAVETRLVDGSIIRSEKTLCALGRIARVGGLRLENAGIALNKEQRIDVDASARTSVPHIYAAGDVIGPPSLASASMEQGRRAARHLLGLETSRLGEWLPTGIYSVPEMACVGLTEKAAASKYGSAVIGFARFDEIARGLISSHPDGMLKMVASPDGVVRGIHIVGEQATELIHIGQMGLIHGATVDTYIENIFNFPTYAEGYRVAALQVAGQLQAQHGGDLDGGQGDLKSA